MSCSTCEKVKTVHTGLEYVWLPETSSVLLPEGTVMRITESLVRHPNMPRGGWQVELRINGQSRIVPGRSASEVRRNAERLFHANGIEVKPHDLWLNLHAQWLPRTPQKYRLIELDQLLALANPAPKAPEDPHAVKSEDSARRDAVMLDFLRLYLRSEAYGYTKFLSLVETWCDIANPVTSPLTGRASVFIPLNGQRSKLEKVPLYSREEATAWLDETVRILGLNRGAKSASIAPDRDNLPGTP